MLVHWRFTSIEQNKRELQVKGEDVQGEAHCSEFNKLILLISVMENSDDSIIGKKLPFINYDEFDKQRQFGSWSHVVLFCYYFFIH